MSPEQVEGRDVDSRTDIYSLSVTLYEAATAQRAFLADSVPAVIQKVLKEYPLPPQGLPPYLMGVLLKAMAKDRDQRYPAAAQMAEDVRLGRSPFRRLAGAPTGAHAIPALRPRPPQPPAPATAARAPGSMPLAERPTGCIAHAGRRAVSACGRCMAPICHACLLELPGGAVLCRRCGFARGPVAAPAPGSRDW
jgi:serine/threonine-protein kinase